MLVQNLFVSILVFYENKRWRNIIIGFLLVVGITVCIDFITVDWIGSSTGFAFAFYFIALSSKVYHKIGSSRIVGREVLAAVFCGFIMLCIIGSFLFLILETITPQSFSNVGEGIQRYNNIRYFSFITCLTIGYGDIVPLNNVAKNLTILMGLAGNFYSIIVTGIVIGKFINNQQSKGK